MQSKSKKSGLQRSKNPKKWESNFCFFITLIAEKNSLELLKKLSSIYRRKHRVSG